MSNKITGATALINLDYDLMHQAGIHWLRHGCDGFPLEADLSTPTESVKRSKALAEEYCQAGFSLMGSTPGPGSYRYSEEKQATVWSNGVPEVFGSWEEDRYYEAVETACEYLARDWGKLVTYWQIANEPDIETFHGDMNRQQVLRFLVASARGLKKGNPKAKPGINLAFQNDFSAWLLPALYGEYPDLFDYLGLDGYLGSWQEGGPEDWQGYIDWAYRLAGKPIIINEWGYSTLQQGPNPDPQGLRRYNQDVCRTKTWEYQWDGPHSEEKQAEYILKGMELFAKDDRVIGEFFFRWSDTETCWQCGDPLCPAECAWGIVDPEGNPKPGYYALKQAYETWYR